MYFTPNIIRHIIPIETPITWTTPNIDPPALVILDVPLESYIPLKSLVFISPAKAKLGTKETKHTNIKIIYFLI